MKVIGWDLETSNLSADFGFIISGGWKVFGEDKTYVKSVCDFSTFKKDTTDDKELVAYLAEELSKADMWVTWYGMYFDIPFLTTRLIKHRMKPLPPIPHMDGWQIARNKLRLHSNRLDSVSKFLGIDEKTPVKGGHWIKAAAGDKKSIEYIVEHNVQDVIVLEQAFELLKPFAGSICKTSAAVLMERTKGCPSCGAEALQKRGFLVGRTNKKQRYQCTKCGSWSVSAAIRFPDLEAR